MDARALGPLCLVLGLLGGGVRPAFGGNCGVCHGEQKTAFENSVHQTYHLYCTDCHGGDAELDAKTLTGERRGAACVDHPAFKGTAEATQLTELCGSCHSDVEKMRPFRIPTDQLAQYKLSYHGKALYEKGDGNTATCISCHGIHEIRRVKDPRSMAHRWNVPKTCATCHADPERMKPYGLASDILEVYEKSVHGAGLIGDHRTGVPTCADCHGIHGAAPPGVQQVENTCGYCHPSARKAFESGPHESVAATGGMDACITCHGHHGVSRPTSAQFVSEKAGGCLDCHTADDAGGRAARQIHDEIDAFEARIRETQEALRNARDEGLFVLEEQGFLNEARRTLVAMRPETHSVSLARVHDLLMRGEGGIREAVEHLASKRKVWRDRKIGSAVVASGLLFLAGLLVLLLRLNRAYRRGAP